MQYGYSQPQAEAWSQTSAQSNGPPTKKVKTGMVTTKYAPPPGYVPPVAQTPPYSSWPVQAATDAQAAQAQQYWAAYGAYAYPGYPDYATYQYYQQYAAQQYAQYGVTYPAATGVPQSAYPSTAYPTTWPSQPQAPNLIEQAARHRHNSAPSLHTEGFFDHSMASKGAGPNDELDESHEDYCEYTRPCYYASRESEIVKDFSIGLIHMKTALPANKALPATWVEANELALLPAPNEKVDGDVCVSGHHSDEYKHDQLVSVRETPVWPEIKDDLMFQSLPTNTHNLIDLKRLRSEFRNRSDPLWLENKPRPCRPSTQQPQRRTSEQFINGRKKRVFSQTESDNNDDASGKRYRQESRARDSGRSVSRNMHYAREGIQARRETQDEVLARLGVTGAPKPAVNPHGQPASHNHPYHQGFDTMDGSSNFTNGTSKARTSAGSEAYTSSGSRHGLKRHWDEANHGLEDTAMLDVDTNHKQRR